MAGKKDLSWKLEPGRSKPQGKCEVGHDQAAWYKLRGHACPCWEREVARPIGRDHHAVRPTDWNGRYGAAPSPEDELIERQARQSLEDALGDGADDLRPDEEKVLALMQELGMSGERMQLVTARVVRGLSFREIAAEMGLPSAKAAAMSYKRAVDAMKARGAKRG